MTVGSNLPTGTVTFLFTDIEGSTKLLRNLGEGFRDVIDQHGEILRRAIAAGRGVEVSTEGDAFFAAFPTPGGALTAAALAQRELHARSWPHGSAVRVRMGMHTGEGVLGGDDYVGLDVHLAARISSAAHGGQVLLTEASRILAAGSLASGISLRDLGLHRLKDIEDQQHLYQLVIDGLPDEFPPIRTLGARPTNLPQERTSFVGRDRETEEVWELLSQSRLLTLTGPGGTGKTRLALKVAGRHLENYKDGVWFVDLSTVTDADLVPSALAEALRVREEAGRECLDSLTGYLRDRHLLLLLDNFEQVVEGATLVPRLLDAASQLTVLATSRIPLHVSGEQEYPVPPLGVPDSHGLPELLILGQFEAVRLFIDRATAVRPGFRVTNENAPAVAEITRRLDGLPLAIELAASRVKLLTPQAILARLGQRLPLLTGGPRDLPDRQRTLRGAIEWSHDLLEPHEQRLFARLAVFSGGSTLEAAEVVCGPGLDSDVLELLGSLVDRSLVRQVEGPEGEIRFTMLETIREYSAERLAASNDEEELRRRHAEYFRDLAGEASGQYLGPDHPSLILRVSREHDNLRAALAWAAARGEAETGLRTAAAMWRFWQERGHLEEGRGWLERLLALPAAAGRDVVRARGLVALAGIAYWQNDYPAANAAYEEAGDIAEEVGDAPLLAEVLLGLAYMAAIAGDMEKTEVLVRQGRDHAEAARDRGLVAEFDSFMGFQELFIGNLTAALESVGKAVAMQREVGSTRMMAENLYGLGGIEAKLGQIDAANRHIREGLQFFVDSENLLGIATGLYTVGLLANSRGDPARAARLLGAARRIGDEAGAWAPPELVSHMYGDPEGEARAALGDEPYEAAHSEGYAMDLDEAVSLAREEIG